MYFDVKAMKPGAGVVRLLVDAADAGEAGRQALSQGLTVLSVSRRQGRLSGAPKRFPLLLFNQELLALLRAGISIIEALETLSEREQRAAVKNVLLQLARRLREGLPLSAALQEHPASFSPLYVATVRASERTSDLEDSLARFVAYQVQQESIREKLFNAAIYPLLLLAVGGLVILFLMGYVVPRFSHIYEDLGSQLPFMSRMLLAWGKLLQEHFVELGVFALLAGFTLANLVRRPAFSAWLGALLWRMPEIGERLRIFQLARFYRTVGMLQRGGMAIVPSLDLAAGLLSPMLQPRLAIARQRIHAGGAMSDALDGAGLTSSVALRMLRVGERAGNMGEMMERIATFHDEETARWAELATKLFGPVLMLIIGLMIGLVVVLLYLPIFQLADSLG